MQDKEVAPKKIASFQINFFFQEYRWVYDILFLLKITHLDWSMFPKISEFIIDGIFGIDEVLTPHIACGHCRCRYEASKAIKFKALLP